MTHDAGSAARKVELHWQTPQQWPVLRDITVLLLAGLDRILTAQIPDWIGHCKALITTSEGSAYASITGAGEAITWRGSLSVPATAATVTLYAVIWGVPEDVVVAAMERAMGDGRWGE